MEGVTEEAEGVVGRGGERPASSWRVGDELLGRTKRMPEYQKAIVHKVGAGGRLLQVMWDPPRPTEEGLSESRASTWQGDLSWLMTLTDVKALDEASHA